MALTKWKAAASGDWSTAAECSTGTVPTAADDVAINRLGNYTVAVTGGAARRDRRHAVAMTFWNRSRRNNSATALWADANPASGQHHARLTRSLELWGAGWVF
jgi:hypothetical protein